MVPLQKEPQHALRICFLPPVLCKQEIKARNGSSSHAPTMNTRVGAVVRIADLYMPWMRTHRPAVNEASNHYSWTRGPINENSQRLIRTGKIISMTFIDEEII